MSGRIVKEGDRKGQEKLERFDLTRRYLFDPKCKHPDDGPLSPTRTSFWYGCNIATPLQLHLYYASYGGDCLGVLYSVDNETPIKEFIVEFKKGSELSVTSTWEQLYYEGLRLIISQIRKMCWMVKSENEPDVPTEGIIYQQRKLSKPIMNFPDGEYGYGSVHKIFIHSTPDYVYTCKAERYPETTTDMYFNNLLARDFIEFVYTEDERLYQPYVRVFTRYSKRNETDDLDEQYKFTTMTEALENVGYFSKKKNPDGVKLSEDEPDRMGGIAAKNIQTGNASGDEKYDEDSVRRF